MDWEKKFTSIVQETEANLARVKQKLNGRVKNKSLEEWASHDYSSTPSPKRSVSLIHYPVSSTPTTHCYNGYHSVVTPDIHYERTNYSGTYKLQEKIDAQNRTIDQLNKLIKTLENEREEYRQQIRDLRAEVSELSDQVLDTRSNQHMEWQVNQMKKEVMKEVQKIREQLNNFRLQNERYHKPKDNLSVSHEIIQEVREDMSEELGFLRKDLDLLKSRMGTLELGLSSTLSDRRNMERRQDSIDRTMQNLSRSPHGRLIDTIISRPSAGRNSEQLQFEHLRSAVSSLKDKLDDTEQRFLTSQQPPVITTNGYLSSSFHKSSRNLEDVELSDDDEDEHIDDDNASSLDLAEYEDSDNIESSKKEAISENVDGGELDLDDLDLSDEDIDDLDVSFGSNDLDNEPI